MHPTKPVAPRLMQCAVALIVAGLLLSCNILNSFTKSTPDTPSSSPSSEVQPTAESQPLETEAPQPTPQSEDAVATSTPLVSENNVQIEVLDFLYMQDFSKQPTDWDFSDYRTESVEGYFSIQNGAFGWEISSTTDNVVMNNPDPAIPLPQDGFLVTVATQIQSPSSPISSGIMFRFQDYENFYFATLSNSGEVSVYAVQNKKRVTLAEQVTSDHFESGKFNRLTVADNHGQYEIRVNDYPAVSFTDDRFQGGSTGLIVDLSAGAQATFLFDDFWVMKMGGSAAVANDDTPTIQPPASESGTYVTYEGDFHGVKYTIDHLENFTHSTSGDWQEFCLDVHDNLCVGVLPINGDWADSKAMAIDQMGLLKKNVSDFNIYHEQSTKTAVDGFPAYWVGCTYTWNGVNYDNSRLFVLVQHVGFIINAYGEPEMMQEYQAAIKKMMESFVLAYN
jgi:hypothetical protein